MLLKRAFVLFMFIVPFIFFPHHLMFAQSKEKPGKCILVFGAHADDVDEIAGGTFAKYIDEGYEGIYVCYINNSAGCNLERTPYYDEGPDFTIFVKIISVEEIITRKRPF